MQPAILSIESASLTKDGDDPLSDHTGSGRSRHLVDAEMRPLLDVFPTVDVTAESLSTVRQTKMPAQPVPAEIVAATDHQRRMVPGAGGAPDVSVDIYRPKNAASGLPCILYIHGGGFVAGASIDQASLLQQLSFENSCVVVSVDYRLAPETAFPGAIEDCYSALKWLGSRSDELSIDRGRVGVMGESAGGGLAAALALLARDRGEHAIAFQHLIYPMLDDRTCVRSDPHPFTGEYMWTARSNRFGWASLLGCEPGSPDVSPYASAARATDLAGLPPTFILTGSLDLFLEEDMEYARRLIRSGVPCELHVYPGAVHGFDLAPPGMHLVDVARRDSRSALSRALRR